MWTLAAETSTPAGSVALFNGRDLVDEVRWEKENSHSERITLEAEKLLTAAKISFENIDRYAVGTGPGSFTGIRVAINFVRTLAFTFDKPVLAVDSLLLMAAPALDQGLEVFCMQSAFRNFVYCAKYSSKPEFKTELEPSALTVEELNSAITRPMTCVGKGFSLFEGALSPDLKKYLHRDSRFHDLPLARNFACQDFLSEPDQSSAKAKAQQFRWNATKPLYIRASEAEEKLKITLRK